MADDESQLLRGVLRLLLLELVGRGETYGYAIVVALRERGLSRAGEGTVYPALARLEREGLLEAHLQASRRGAARKYYRLTEAGEQARRQARDAWEALAATVTDVIEDKQGETHAAT